MANGDIVMAIQPAILVVMASIDSQPSYRRGKSTIYPNLAGIYVPLETDFLTNIVCTVSGFHISAQAERLSVQEWKIGHLSESCCDDRSACNKASISQ
jgi:hypothetical protein